jgi:hypothetical protein
MFSSGGMSVCSCVPSQWERVAATFALFGQHFKAGDMLDQLQSSVGVTG